MSFWTAIVIIVAIISVAQVLQARHRARHGITTDIMGNETPIEPPTNPALEREVAELRERVKVLERIATEDRETKLLSAEIESLREK
jgi:N-acyl-D-aspartate/D-glutamate deacylase